MEMATTAGYPAPPTLSPYSKSKLAPPSDHKKLKGFPLNLLATFSYWFKYLTLSSVVESARLGTKRTIQAPLIPTHLSSKADWLTIWVNSAGKERAYYSSAHLWIDSKSLCPS